MLSKNKIRLSCSRLLYSQKAKRPPYLMEFLKDLIGYLLARKKWWLLPILIVTLLLGVLLVLGSNSAIAPFIYTLF